MSSENFCPGPSLLFQTLLRPVFVDGHHRQVLLLMKDHGRVLIRWDEEQGERTEIYEDVLLSSSEDASSKEVCIPFNAL
ncbi:hypothetical protein CEXT_296671 [Caerostris extrusa]|uniref:Uncharacterized protein n=1 Tax=Caerostris extrusa TaxID=172846 RepID=A0AAV4R6I9_CAEEX|nr:hypothetical protein CEXT_296671 [Caerostris extrusa]